MKGIKELEAELNMNHNEITEVLKKLQEGSIAPKTAQTLLERLAKKRKALKEKLINVIMK